MPTGSSYSDSAYLEKLVAAAKAAATRSYSPYSMFAVGAAAVADNDEIYTGCNVENASYGLGICAERVAISNAIAAGARVIRLLVIYTPTDLPTAPCGACRQFLREFAAPKIEIICVSRAPELLRFQGISELLPHSFGPEQLGPKSARSV